LGGAMVLAKEDTTLGVEPKAKRLEIAYLLILLVLLGCGSSAFPL